MSDQLSHFLNQCSPDEARDALLRCCGSERWVAAMLRARPFCSDTSVCETADRVWNELESSDWLEAASHHPRIGDRPTRGSWSSAEQSGMDSAQQQTVDALRRHNLEYEQKFGFVFLICATGLDSDTMLAAIRQRLENDRNEELRHLHSEQAKITRLRLQKLVPRQESE